MKPFMSEDFLLDNDTARTLYHKYAASLPILDYWDRYSKRRPHGTLIPSVA